MYFGMKSYLNSTRNYTVKHAFNLFHDFLLCMFPIISFFKIKNYIILFFIILFFYTVQIIKLIINNKIISGYVL
jgi:hypothetical protein